MFARYPVDHRDLSDQDHLILKVLRLYYKHDLTQAEISRRMGFSRPKVSKLITEGKNRGLVKIEVAEPTGDSSSLEIMLEDRYGLAEALVVDSQDDTRANELAVGLACGAILSRLCTPATTLGVSWGRSLRGLADAVPPHSFVCSRVVPLVGGMGRAKSALHSNQICTTLAEKVDAESTYLSAPAIARSASSRDELLGMPGIGDVLREGAACDVAVAGLGAVLPSSTMVEAGYFSLSEFLGFREHGAVGDVCCHFLDAEGGPCLPDLSSRIVGLGLGELAAIPRVIGLAAGAEKSEGVAAVLKGGHVDTLVCDRDLARSLLETESNESQTEGVTV